jgi:hypothetical protein
VQVGRHADREAVTALLRCVEYVDLVIPRGGKGLVSLVRAEAQVPTLLHLDGNCHSYVHGAADPQRPLTVCATPSCGAPVSAAPPRAWSSTRPSPPSCFRASRRHAECELARRRAGDGLRRACQAATDEDWGEEYLDAILSVRVVDDLAEAIDFISAHSSGPHGRDSHAKTDGGRALPERHRLRGGHAQRLDAVFRRRRVRHGRRNRHRHGQDARPRPRGPRAADQLQVPGSRQRDKQGARIMSIYTLVSLAAYFHRS